MIADFYVPVAPTGWLECDGSSVSTTTYAALFAALTIQQSGSRGSGLPQVTSLSSTANMKVGYYVAGAGIPSGAKILTVDSSTQITLDANASSSGTNTVYVSPCAMAAGTTPSTVTLPNATTSGRYRRSRTSSTAIGVVQTDSINAHLHAVSLTSGTESAAHSHSGTTDGQNADHTHTVNVSVDGRVSGAAAGSSGGNIWFGSGSGGSTFGFTGDHQHSFSTGSESANHTHSVSGNTANNTGAGTETRPLTIVCMTCIKT